MSEIIELGGHVLKKLSELPKDPGIYKFLDKRREVLYIGKAKNLSNRTKSYFTCLLYTSPSPRDRSVSRMPSSA